MAVARARDWAVVPAWSVFRRLDQRNRPDGQLLSVYRDYGVIPKASRDDNYNKPSDDLSTYRWVRHGDLVLNKMKTWQGSLAVSQHHGIVSPAYIVCEISSPLLPRFAHYLLRSEPYIALYRDLSVGIRPNQWDLGFDEFKTIPILLPSIEEQGRVADFLDDQVTRIEKAVDLRQRSITLLRHRADAEMVAAAFPTDVSTSPITYVADFLTGRQRSPENEMGAYMTPYVRSANVKDGVVEMDNLNLMNFTPAEQDTYRLLRGDVLVTEASGSPEAIGAAGVWMGDNSNTACFQNHLIRVRPKSGRACWEFLALWARASHRSGSFRSWATGAQILNLGVDSLKRVPVAQLTLEEQIDVARLWNDRESLWLSLDATGVNQVRLLRERKRALITACVTGEFDVSSASTRAADAVIR